MEILIDQVSAGMKNIEEMKKQAQDCARICYSTSTLDGIHLEEVQKGLLSVLLKNGHHSPFDHPTITLYFRNIPKIGAMILNNERPNATSEKSARYTKMQLSPIQEELYNKWMEIFQKQIIEKYPETAYPKLYDKSRGASPVEKLAQENARYLTSVNTPTFMAHTLSLRKLNETAVAYERSLQELPNTPLNEMIKTYMQEFLASPAIQASRVPNLRHKSNKLINLIADRNDYSEEFGENFSTNYKQTFAYLAQAHRHRTLNYNIQPLSENRDDWKFFIPPIISMDGNLALDWHKDIQSVAQNDIPQGTMIQIHENGNYQEFIWKCYERLCGHAQWEIMDRTGITLNKYLTATENTNSAVHEILKKFSHGPRCTFPNHQCDKEKAGCSYGPREALTRVI
jgi:thymidylate synthase ThyX